MDGLPEFHRIVMSFVWTFPSVHGADLKSHENFGRFGISGLINLEVSEAEGGDVNRLVQVECEKARCTAVWRVERVNCATLYLLFSSRRVLIPKFFIQKYLLYF